MKQEIKPDAVSHKSNNSINQIPSDNPSVKPDFKKKRKDPAII